MADGRSDDRPGGAPLVGIVEEGHHGPGDQIPGGLVPGHRSRRKKRSSSSWVSWSRRSRLGEDTEEILVGVEPLLLAQLVGVGEELHRRLDAGLGRHWYSGSSDPIIRLTSRRPGAGPLGDAHQVGDHLEGKLR